jgi:hypothetical protein
MKAFCLAVLLTLPCCTITFLGGCGQRELTLKIISVPPPVPDLHKNGISGMLLDGNCHIQIFDDTAGYEFTNDEFFQDKSKPCTITEVPSHKLDADITIGEP